MPTDPYLAYNFVVEIEGLLAGGFAACSGLEVESEFFEYREGGVNDHAHQLWGPAKSPPLVLERGIASADALWAWYREVARGQLSRRNGTIHLMNRQRDIARSWNFRQALPRKWTGPQLRADSNMVAFEQVELVHRGWT